MGQFNLQASFSGARAVPENLKDESRAVEDLGVPGFLQIALLHRCQRMIYDDEVGIFHAHYTGKLLYLAGAEQGRGLRLGHLDDPAFADVQVDRCGKPNGFVEPRLRRTIRRVGCEAAGRFRRLLV
jgi:hypothetical protein